MRAQCRHGMGSTRETIRLNCRGDERTGIRVIPESSRKRPRTSILGNASFRHQENLISSSKITTSFADRVSDALLASRKGFVLNFAINGTGTTAEHNASSTIISARNGSTPEMEENGGSSFEFQRMRGMLVFPSPDEERHRHNSGKERGPYLLVCDRHGWIG